MCGFWQRRCLSAGAPSWSTHTNGRSEVEHIATCDAKPENTAGGGCWFWQCRHLAVLVACVPCLACPSVQGAGDVAVSGSKDGSVRVWDLRVASSAQRPLVLRGLWCVLPSTHPCTHCRGRPGLGALLGAALPPLLIGVVCVPCPLAVHQCCSGWCLGTDPMVVPSYPSNGDSCSMPHFGGGGWGGGRRTRDLPWPGVAAVSTRPPFHATSDNLHAWVRAAFPPCCSGRVCSLQLAGAGGGAGTTLYAGDCSSTLKMWDLRMTSSPSPSVAAGGPWRQANVIDFAGDAAPTAGLWASPAAHVLVSSAIAWWAPNNTEVRRQGGRQAACCARAAAGPRQ